MFVWVIIDYLQSFRFRKFARRKLETIEIFKKRFFPPYLTIFAGTDFSLVFEHLTGEYSNWSPEVF